MDYTQHRNRAIFGETTQANNTSNEPAGNGRSIPEEGNFTVNQCRLATCSSHRPFNWKLGPGRLLRNVGIVRTALQGKV